MGSGVAVVKACCKGACYKGVYYKGVCYKRAYCKGACYKESGISGRVGIRGRVGLRGRVGIGNRVSIGVVTALVRTELLRNSRQTLRNYYGP